MAYTPLYRRTSIRGGGVPNPNIPGFSSAVDRLRFEMQPTAPAGQTVIPTKYGRVGVKFTPSQVTNPNLPGSTSGIEPGQLGVPFNGDPSGGSATMDLTQTPAEQAMAAALAPRTGGAPATPTPTANPTLATVDPVPSPNLDVPDTAPQLSDNPLADNIVPFARDTGVFQGPDIPPTLSVADEIQRHTAETLDPLNAQLDAILNPDAPTIPRQSGGDKAATAASRVTTPPAIRAPQFVSSSNKPQWSDVVGGGEQDNLYRPYKTAGSKSDSHLYAPATERYYQRALDRYDANGRRADANRVIGYQNRVLKQYE